MQKDVGEDHQTWVFINAITSKGKMAKHWALSKSPEEYLHSSAKFYETTIANFSFLKQLMDEF